MNTMPLSVAFIPMAIYLISLGIVHLRRRPRVISGTWDWVGIALAAIGLVVVGPLALVQPAAGAAKWSWPMLLTLYGLIVALCVLAARPRMVIYNTTVQQLRPLVAEVAMGLDPLSRWAGESVALPSRGVQVHVDGNSPMRTVAVIALGERPPIEGWSEFSRKLAQSVGKLRVRRSPWGYVFLAISLGLFAWNGFTAFNGQWEIWLTSIEVGI